ncbi:hypothetical protein BKA70DRAFT_1233662 [Coprinopsis sp. MPI-PUGE-AT-0042]|nr:hypothetical protein BKA70DRAFT_1233662 [Coprinopsis sp. MPI-PUGE-AT-0042]
MAGKDLFSFQAVILHLLPLNSIPIPPELFPGVPRRESEPKADEFLEATCTLCPNCLKPSTVQRTSRAGWDTIFAKKIFSKFAPFTIDWVDWSSLAHMGLATYMHSRAMEGLGNTPEERVAACLDGYCEGQSSSHGSTIFANLMACCASAMMLFQDDLGSSQASMQAAVVQRLDPSRSNGTSPALGQDGSQQDVANANLPPNLTTQTGALHRGQALGRADRMENKFTVMPRALQLATLFSPLAVLANTLIARLNPRTSSMMKAGLALSTLRHPDLHSLEVAILTFIVEVTFNLQPSKGAWSSLLQHMKTAASSTPSALQRRCYDPNTGDTFIIRDGPYAITQPHITAPPTHLQEREESVVPYLMDEAEIPRIKRYNQGAHIDEEEEDDPTDFPRPAKRPRLDPSPSVRHVVAEQEKSRGDDEDMLVDQAKLGTTLPLPDEEEEEEQEQEQEQQQDGQTPLDGDVEEEQQEDMLVDQAKLGTTLPLPDEEEEEEQEQEQQQGGQTPLDGDVGEEQQEDMLGDQAKPGTNLPLPEEQEEQEQEEQEQSGPNPLGGGDVEEEQQEEDHRMSISREEEDEEQQQSGPNPLGGGNDNRREDQQQQHRKPLGGDDGDDDEVQQGSTPPRTCDCDEEACVICGGIFSDEEGDRDGNRCNQEGDGGGVTRTEDEEEPAVNQDQPRTGEESDEEREGSRQSKGNKGKAKQSPPPDKDEEPRLDSPSPPWQDPEPIEGITDLYMSIDDCVSDMETVMGTRCIVRGRFRRSHVDGWTTKRWYNKVHVEGWLKGLQGVEVVPSCPDISTTAKPKKNLCPSPSLNLKVWMATGLPVDLHPRSYHESEETTLVRYITEVMNSYVDGIPRHISIKVDLPSCVKPISFASWEAMSKAEQSDSLCRFQVLVYDCPYIRGGGFDEDTLGRYVQLDRHTTMTGICHLQEITDHSLDPEGPRQEAIPKRRPRVLNAIGTLLHPSTPEFETHNLCDAAFEATQGSMGPGPSPSKPSGKDWLLVSNAWSFHGPHVDEGGGGTIVDTIVGGKLWMVLTPKWPNENQGTAVLPQPADYWKVFGETKFWEAVADGDDSIKELENCQWEGVLLPPRSRLNRLMEGLSFMRSNTVHRVITVDHSIVKGGHFFNRGTLMETFFNNIVCLLGGKVLTNTEHPGMRVYIHRILILHYEHYCLGRPHRQYKHHLLDPEKPEEMSQLQALLMLGVLEDVLNPRNYALGRQNAERAAEGLDPIARTPARAIYASYIKGISWTIVQWLTSCFSFSATASVGGETRIRNVDRFKEQWWFNMVGMQLAVLQTWRTRLVKLGMFGSVHDETKLEIAANTDTLVEELALVAEHHRDIWAVYQEYLQKPGDYISPLVPFSWSRMAWTTTRVKTYFEEREGWQIVRLGINSNDMPILQDAGQGPFVLPPYSDD